MGPRQVIADRFEIERLAESGGMGSVYLARDRLTGEPVALKLLARANARWAERFRREALVLAELAHPAIVRYVAHGVSPNSEPWLAMEWLDGEPLSVRLRRGRMAIVDGRDLGIRIAEALTVAHAAGVVHRDLKPANVFLVDGDVRQAKLLDFGVARRRSQVSDTTRTGDKVGTPRYMAPEQVRAARTVDWRCDLWSLGCLLYTSLAGRPPFSAADEMATWGKILLEEAPPLSAARPDAPPALVALVRRLLEKVPTLRPASAAAVADELRRIERPEVADSTGITAVGASLATSSEHRRVAIVMVGTMGEGSDDAPSVSREDTAPSAPIYVELAACAERHGGSFEALARGGAIITMAGSPSATDLVARAARCALDARAVCDAPLALASGRSTVGTVPVGDAIDRAATLLRRAVGGRETDRRVAVDEVTAALLGPRFAVEGGPTPWLTAERADDGLRVILGRSTPTVGRERELAMLLGACTDAADEPAARAVVVTGEAGVGKSRLRHELIDRLEGLTERPRVWLGRGDPVRAGSPFSLIGSALRRRIGAAEQLATDEERATAQHCVAAAVTELELAEPERVVVFLSEMIGAPWPAASSAMLAAARRQPRMMSDQLRRAFLDLAVADAGRQPLAWVLDDLHWGDQPSIELIDEALRAMDDGPLCVIAFARPEVEGLFPRLWAQRGATQVRLGPLSRKAAARLVRDVLGARTPEPTVARIVERADGNAFYLEELIRAAAAGDAELPESVVAMVQVRLEGLPAPARQVLRAASVLGGRFARRPLLALLGRDLPERELDQLLDDLVTRELLSREVSEEREYGFRHELYREAAYGLLLDADRRMAHRSAGLWLEAQRERDAFTVAQHLEEGGEVDKAALWYRYAADQALEAGDPHAVIDRAARGLECGAAEAERGLLLLLAAEAHDWLGETEATERCALEAMDVAREGSATWLRAAAELAVAAGRQGNHGLLIGLARDVLRVRKGEARAARVIAFALIASELYLAGHAEHGKRVMVRLEDQADVCAHDALADGWLWRARGIEAVVAGDTVRALELMRGSAVRMEAVGAERDLVAGLINIGFLEVQVGRFTEAEATLRRAKQLADGLGAVRAQTMATQNLALALLYGERPDEALVLARAAERMARGQGSLRVAGAAAIYQARALLALDRASDARLEATRAVDTLSSIAPTLAYALAVRADSELALGRLDPAATAARAAERIIADLGSIDEGDAYVRLTIARVLTARGQDELAARVAGEAWARIESAAAGLADDGDRAIFLAVPEHAALRALAGR